MKKAFLRTAAAVVLATMCGALAFGQAVTTGAITGTVTDVQGGVVAGATVTVRNNGTGTETTMQSGDNGTFSAASLPSGTYTVTFTAPNFKKAVVQDVVVSVGTPSSINIGLEVGAVTETVTITGAGGELLQTQTATVGTTITGRQITDLPQSSRDALDLVLLLPGTNTPGSPRTSTVNGLPKGSLNITLDGVNVQDNNLKSAFGGGFFTYVRPRIDAIDEVTVSTATPGAESSGEGAVQIKFASRSGSQAEVRGLVPDYLGTPRITASQTGSLRGITRHDYIPFGEEIGTEVGGRSTGQGYSDDNVRQKFTGYERNSEIGLDFAQARYYNSLQDRFSSPDPPLVSAVAVSPQAWNRCAYVNNKPLKYLAPDGRQMRQPDMTM